MPTLKIFSFFSGAGFLDLGFESAGFQIDFVNEISPSFTEAYRYARSRMGIAEPIYGYSADINAYLGNGGKDLKKMIRKSRKGGNLVGFIGGPPCPDFSIAGKQKGKSGDHGKLSKSYIDLIIEQRPDYFLFENVKGLWKTAKHREFYEELKTMLSKYYKMTDRLCNAIEFGAPQDRDRILLFGVKKTTARKFKVNINDFDWNKHMLFTLKDVKAINWPKTSCFSANSVSVCPQNIPIELTAEYWFKRNDVEQHPNANDYFTPRAGLAKMQAVYEGDDSKKSYKRIHRWRYSPTVCYGNNEVHLHPYKERRLSAAEALSLQSLPKEFVLPPSMTLSDKFKTIGNGVPFMLAKGIAETIKDFFNR